MGLQVQSNVFITKTKKEHIQKIDFASLGEPTQTLDNYYSRLSLKPDILINGGFFNFSDGKPTMDYIDEGVVKASDPGLVCGMGIDMYGNLCYGQDKDKHWIDFISGYPPLVVNGQKVPISMAVEISGRARRTILGYDENYVYTFSIDNPGATFSEAADIVLKTGCTYAINLDGGGSTRLLYNGKPYAVASYNRPVDNAVAIYLKDAYKEVEKPAETPQIIYRVQVGAFGLKQNATAFCNQVKNLGSNYKNAFITQVGNLYKVQVGAFSVKQNAENMLKDLQLKGYNPFIVTEKKTNVSVPEPQQEVKEEKQEMSNSPLIAVKMLSPNCSKNRTHSIDRITPHCVVGQCSAEALGAWFQKQGLNASSNYGIDKDGRIGLYVEEKDRSWCSSSTANDDRAITVECASDTFDPYRMNEVVFQSLIRLCIDVCKRYHKTKLLWFNDKATTLNYEPKKDEMIITVHRWFANKSCPGDWLYNRLGELATTVTNALAEEDEDMTQEKFNEMMETWIAEQANKDTTADWSAEARIWAEQNGFVQGDDKGRKMYKKYITREEFITVVHRIIKKLGLIK